MAQPEERRIPELSRSTAYLPRKPKTPLWFGLARGRGKLAETHLVVFLNGLIGTQTVWDETVAKLLASWKAGESGAGGDATGPGHPALLTYDRYGQGDSGRDPTDDPEFGHGLPEVVADLKDLVVEIWRQQLGFELPPEPPHLHPTHPPATAAQQHSEWLKRLPRLVFVANSIGCVVGRYFAQTYPGPVSALLFLDSNIANSDQVSLFPDPDAPGFDPGALPDGVTVAALRETRAKYREMFHPSVRNPENLDRRGVAALLPHADEPHLVSFGSPPPGHGPWITVVGHDPARFADDCATGSLHCPRALTNAYVNPAWARYNEGLTRLTGDAERRTGPLVADRCGHFIQVDDPGLVARLLRGLLGKLGGE
ncbi:hypothetical protein SLS62_006383 [Diatrype stigma]|uniref:AB hydrolase-1 domain-containing protein n=1 Tax=Diatrype stigma TaxID=117547 RepID=A0AAN9URL5_9PEZI